MKLLSIVLCLLMLFPVLPSSAEEDISGIWYARIMKIGDDVYPFSLLGFDCFIELNSDGTYRHVIMSDTLNGRWKYSEENHILTLTRSDNGASSSILWTEDDYLLQYEDEAIVYQRGPAPIAKPEEIRAESIDSFTGNWIAAYIEFTEVFVLTDELSLMGLGEFYSSAVIDPESLFFSMNTESSDPLLYDASVRFENGALTVGDCENVGFRIDRIFLTENGILKIPVIDKASNEISTIFYYLREE